MNDSQSPFVSAAYLHMGKIIKCQKKKILRRMRNHLRNEEQYVLNYLLAGI